MKKTLMVLGVMAAFSLSSLTVSAAGIPTADAVGAAQRVEQLLNMKKQIENQISQIRNLEAQVKSMTGSRNLGEILNNPLLRDSLPKDWKKVYDSVQKGGYKGLDGATKAIADAAGLLEPCKGLVSTAKTSCENSALQTAQQKNMYDKAIASAETRLGQIEGLMKKINLTQDPKAIAELTARIQTEQASIQNEQTRLQLVSKMIEANEKIAQQESRNAQSDYMKSNQRSYY